MGAVGGAAGQGHTSRKNLFVRWCYRVVEPTIFQRTDGRENDLWTTVLLRDGKAGNQAPGGESTRTTFCLLPLNRSVFLLLSSWIIILSQMSQGCIGLVWGMTPDLSRKGGPRWKRPRFAFRLPLYTRLHCRKLPNPSERGWALVCYPPNKIFFHLQLLDSLREYIKSTTISFIPPAESPSKDVQFR